MISLMMGCVFHRVLLSVCLWPLSHYLSFALSIKSTAALSLSLAVSLSLIFTPPLRSLPYQSNGTSHKRLQWTHVLGNAVVKGTFGKHSYDLQVHTLQAIALMEFNVTKGEVSAVTVHAN